MAAGCTLVINSTPGRAQAHYDWPEGRVEVLGLHRWTLGMLQDSIRRYVPGQTLHDAACVVTLRDSLHFVEADVNRWEMSPPGAPKHTFLAIKVIEPADAMRVQWDTRPRNEFSSLLPAYADFVMPVTDSAGGLWPGRLLNGLQLYGADSLTRNRVLDRAPSSTKADAHRVWAFLGDHRAEADRQRAMRVLQQDGFYVNRLVAVSMLANFPANDSTWWSLARSLRDPHEAVREFAAVVLRNLPRHRLDWTPATGDLRLLLGGTNLTAMRDVWDALLGTEVDPKLAPALLRDNAQWLLQHLESEAPGASDAAHALLVRLNRGTDLGHAPSAWAQWVSSL